MLNNLINMNLIRRGVTCLPSHGLDSRQNITFGNTDSANTIGNPDLTNLPYKQQIFIYFNYLKYSNYHININLITIIETISQVASIVIYF